MPPHRGKFISYYRVSTQRQGDSGLGLDAQRRAVRDYLVGGSWQLVSEFTEVESGKHAARPELAKALAQCKRERAKLVERFQSSNHMGCSKRPHPVDGKPKMQLSSFMESVV
jgi:hypothetical protein